MSGINLIVLNSISIAMLKMMPAHMDRAIHLPLCTPTLITSSIEENKLK
jgi:hypothetical protein